MRHDYPAAHSMDTWWFAVDERGQVAIFDTGENGHAPQIIQEQQDDSVFDLLDLLRAPEVTDPRELIETATALGLFFYEYPEDFAPIGVYQRMPLPATPLHVDQLPPRFRDECVRVRFSIRFDEAGLIQPLEEHSCHYWCMDERVAYLCADGVTVRPIPGKEGVFDDFVQEFRRQNPELAENYRFAGPTE